MNRRTRAGAVVAAGVAGIMAFGALQASAACELCKTLVGTAEGTLIEPNPLERQIRTVWDPVANRVQYHGDLACEVGEQAVDDVLETDSRILDGLVAGVSDVIELTEDAVSRDGAGPGDQQPGDVYVNADNPVEQVCSTSSVKEIDLIP